MCSNEPMKPKVKQELAAKDDDVVEILPRRAVTPNGGGFSVTIRDTSELTLADIDHVKPFLRRPTIEPTTVALPSMKEVPTTGGWEIVIEDTSTLTSMHIRSIIDVIASRERELRSRSQHPHAPRQQQSPAGAQIQPAVGPQTAANLAGAFAAGPPPAKKRQSAPKDPNAPKRPLNAFFWFLRENRHRWTHPGMPAPEATKAASVAWAALPEEEKQRWYKRAADDKERYDREMIEYRRGTRND